MSTSTNATTAPTTSGGASGASAVNAVKGCGTACTCIHETRLIIHIPHSAANVAHGVGEKIRGEGLAAADAAGASASTKHSATDAASLNQSVSS